MSHYRTILYHSSMLIVRLCLPTLCYTGSDKAVKYCDLGLLVHFKSHILNHLSSLQVYLYVTFMHSNIKRKTDIVYYCIILTLIVNSQSCICRMTKAICNVWGRIKGLQTPSYPKWSLFLKQTNKQNRTLL